VHLALSALCSVELDDSSGRLTAAPRTASFATDIGVRLSLHCVSVAVNSSCIRWSADSPGNPAPLLPLATTICYRRKSFAFP
jgi:hypothetical protein